MAHQMGSSPPDVKRKQVWKHHLDYVVQNLGDLISQGTMICVGKSTMDLESHSILWAYLFNLY